jgi:hypothetical protein
MISLEKKNYTKITNKKYKRKRIKPTSTNIHTKQGNIITLKGEVNIQDVHHMPGFMGVSWEYKGKVINKSWSR